MKLSVERSVCSTLWEALGWDALWSRAFYRCMDLVGCVLVPLAAGRDAPPGSDPPVQKSLETYWMHHTHTHTHTHIYIYELKYPYMLGKKFRIQNELKATNKDELTCASLVHSEMRTVYFGVLSHIFGLKFWKYYFKSSMWYTDRNIVISASKNKFE